MKLPTILILVYSISFCFFNRPMYAQNALNSNLKDHTTQTGIFLDVDSGGHKAYIRKLLFSKDGKFIISVSDDKTIRIWDVNTGNAVKVLRHEIGIGGDGKIFSADLSPNGRVLAIAGKLGTKGNRYITLFDYISEQVLMVLEGHSEIIDCVKFSPDGKYLISGSIDKTARIWDLESGNTVHILSGHQNKVRALAFSQNGKIVATGSSDETIKLWNVKTGTLIKTLKGHKHHVRSLAFSPKSGHLFSVSGDKTIKIWDGISGRYIRKFAKLPSAGTGLSFSKNGEILVVGHQGSGDSICYAYDVSKAKVLSAFDKHGNLANVLAIAISPDGKTVVSGGGENHEIFSWNPITGKEYSKMSGVGTPIWQVAFNKRDDSIAFGRHYNKSSLFGRGFIEQKLNIEKDLSGRLKIGISNKFQKPLSMDEADDYSGAIQSANDYKIVDKTGQTLQIYRNNRLHKKILRTGFQGYSHLCATLTSDGKHVFSGGMNGYLLKYSTDTGKIVQTLKGHTDGIACLAVSSDNKFLLSGSRDQTIKLWDVDSGRLIWTIFVGTDNEWIIWTPAGYYIASNYGDKYIGWRINNGAGSLADFYSADQFERILYRPDYVNAFLYFRGNFKKIETISGRTIFSISQIREIAPPKITINSPPHGQLIKQKQRLKLQFHAAATHVEMKDYSIFLNNIPITPASERILKKQEKISFKREIEIPLYSKINKIRIEVFNGISMGLAETEVYKPSQIKQQPIGSLYLLSIGINNFNNMPAFNLKYAVSDAKSIAGIFKKLEGKTYGKVHVKSLIDSSKTTPTKANILASLDFIKSAKSIDTVIIFLASHGLSDKAGNYYFVPCDANLTDVKSIVLDVANRGITVEKDVSSFISWNRFFDALRSVPGKRLLVVDTCHAKGISGTLDMHSLKKKSASSSFALLAAAKGDEKSQEYPHKKQGLFTYSLLEGLSGKGDLNSDGRVTLAELYDFSSELVDAILREYIDRQTPQLVAPKELKHMVLSSVK